MYLKSIDMYGFKSFAQKMVFKFDEGITAIVGPNGSGKSNIADAVRWVLGEQSAKLLRGAKMQDVIFAGTETRKPLGYCQVDLTIDNHDMKMLIDYSEVTISRRVYRSGESEYSINGVECRLKDVHELFMDTGVGKEGYSIIGQGQIDKILSSKPDDRRELFDEATGIVKFKKRKMVAEKNLEEEKQNLVRINDIVRELHGQQDALKDQALVAKQYLEHKEHLKKYEVNIFINESEKLNQSIDEITEKENISNGQIEDLRAGNEKIKEQYSKLANHIEKLENEIDAKKEIATHFAIDKEKKESSIELVKEQISNLSKNCERIQNLNEELESKKERGQVEKTTYLESLDDIKTSCKEKESVLVEKQGEFEKFGAIILEDEFKIEQIRTNRIERLNEISNVKTKIQRYHTMLENVEARKATLDLRDKNLVETHNSRLIGVNDYQNELDITLINQQKLALKKDDLKGTLAKKEIEISKYEQLVRGKSEQLHTTQSKFKALSEMSDHYEGYSYSIKKIMEIKKSGAVEAKGVMGVVADLIEVNKTYETAIEIALGGSVQNIVTDDETTAKNLIQYLKNNKFGRATFLPIVSVKSKEVFHRPFSKKEVGFIGYASELVNCEKRFSNVIEYLLGRVLVVDNIDHAIGIAKKYNYSLKIVTLSGDLIHPGGSLTGGAHKNGSNQFLSRKNDIENYEKQINIFSKELEDLKKQYILLSDDYTSDKNDIEAITKQEYEVNLKINEISLKLKQLEKEQEQFNEEKKEIKMELDQLYGQEAQIVKATSELDLLLDGTQAENTTDESSVKQLTDEIQDKKNLKDQLAEELTVMRVEVSALKQQLENTVENTTRMSRDLSEINNQISRNKEEIQKSNQDISEKEKAILSFELEMKELEIKLTEAQKEIEVRQANKQKVLEEQQNLYKLREEQNEKVNLLEKDILRLQNTKEKYELQRENQIDYMWNEYELTYNNALYLKDEELGSVANLKKMIMEIKGNIKELGDVNVNAIEEFKSVSERYSFLMDQKEDLLRAEEMLKKVIEELHQQMIEQFKLKFKEISIKFNEVFRELFGGGKAMLEIAVGEDILESGIELIAQPPGKKLQSMNLLSGGEKAFTAIALLFAIQSLKPSPFCVLDEIEAALDDSNVTRFANYLKKLAKNTQFIIITHRRGTMEAADSLYGITMQEKGISTQVSVKLLEDSIED
ncbi:MAG: chromosome segregation protein SMC [Firmicutes bacterium HGW-Firmicutes-1]|jgi:chromosome segregation protein|nr:MAG: chromosome segregation protein SMC [Firmicutes bacterium HGW-Firmicutes-1]